MVQKIRIPKANWRQKIGKAPGSLIYTGKTEKLKKPLDVIQYHSDEIIRTQLKNTGKLEKLAQGFNVNWYNLNALNQEEWIRALGDEFAIHNLWLEDIMNVEHLPKVDFDDDKVLFILKMIRLNPEDQGIDIEHICLFRKGPTVVSFQEKEGDVFNPLRERILEKIGKVRDRSSDYLLYLLLDAVVDQYYLVFSNYQDQIEAIEAELLKNPTEELLTRITGLKAEIIQIRRYIFPLRDAVRKLINDLPQDFAPYTPAYYSDLQDHVNYIHDQADSMRESASNLLDQYMNMVSFRMNKVMEKLTVIATIFIPLTFVAGIYGMNFQTMPELTWDYGYYWALGFMAILGLIMYFYMKRKNWF